MLTKSLDRACCIRQKFSGGSLGRTVNNRSRQIHFSQRTGSDCCDRSQDDAMRCDALDEMRGVIARVFAVGGVGKLVSVEGMFEK